MRSDQDMIRLCSMNQHGSSPNGPVPWAGRMTARRGRTREWDHIPNFLCNGPENTNSTGSDCELRKIKYQLKAVRYNKTRLRACRTCFPCPRLLSSSSLHGVRAAPLPAVVPTLLRPTPIILHLYAHQVAPSYPIDRIISTPNSVVTATTLGLSTLSKSTPLLTSTSSGPGVPVWIPRAEASSMCVYTVWTI
jgi:hypothetical protein